MVNETQEIKKMLTKNYPKNKFSVSKSNCAIIIKTDALPESPQYTDAVWRATVGANPTQEDYQEKIKYDEQIKQYNEKEAEIKKLIKNYEKIDYDEMTSEILSGGNTFIRIISLGC